MSALSEWSALLGERANTKTGPYTSNITEFKARRIVAVLRPKSTAEVRKVVAIAAKYRVPLYPVSTGKNWGLGSQLPVRSGCAIVDLSLMNQILEIDDELHCAVVEPGVTQRQLSDALQHSPCMLNVTGSGEHVSVVGNALERGVGVLGQRSRELHGLEAVLANGKLIRTGHWTFGKTPNRHHHPEGCGPDITGLFVQSGFGIVTKAVISLFPKQDTELVMIKSSDNELARHIDILRGLRQKQLLGDRIEINREDDPRLIGLAKPDTDNSWLTWSYLRGSPDLTKPIKKILLKSFGDVSFYSLEDNDTPEPVRTRLRKLSGEPGDEYMHAMAGKHVGSESFAYDADKSATGFICVLPAIPFIGQCARQAIAAVSNIDSELELKSNMTFNSVSASGLEGFFRVSFDRTNKKEVSKAHRWAKRAQSQLTAAGFPPARTSIDGMYYDSGHQEMTLALKKAVDPYGIISPGRYLSD